MGWEFRLQVRTAGLQQRHLEEHVDPTVLALANIEQRRRQRVRGHGPGLKDSDEQ
jgi:hypothetical protein